MACAQSRLTAVVPWGAVEDGPHQPPEDPREAGRKLGTDVVPVPWFAWLTDVWPVVRCDAVLDSASHSTFHGITCAFSICHRRPRHASLQSERT